MELIKFLDGTIESNNGILTAKRENIKDNFISMNVKFAIKEAICRII